MFNPIYTPRGGGNYQEPKIDNNAGEIVSDATVKKGGSGHMEVKEELEASPGPSNHEGGEGGMTSEPRRNEVNRGGQSVLVRGGAELVTCTTEAKTIEESNRLIAMCSKKLGSLKALSAFFLKLQRLGVGTTRAENMAADITWQNVLRSEQEVLKEKGKTGQEKDSRTVRIILR